MGKAKRAMEEITARMKPPIAIETGTAVNGGAMTITTPRAMLAIFTIFIVVGCA
jgi:hypothetical protein